MLAVDVIVFDLDGTLVDSREDIAQSVHALQKHYGVPPSSLDVIAGFIGDGVGKLVERSIGQRPPEVLAEAVEIFKTHYREHALDHTYAYDGVRETLEHFRAKKMAVVTNKPARISERILRGLKLFEFVPVVVGGDSTAFKKPHPDGLYLALEKLGMPKTKRAMMVGDSAQDVLAGRAAGFHTCAIQSNIGNARLLEQSLPDYTISSLLDLTRIIN